MKRVILACSVLTCIAFAAVAQDQQTHPTPPAPPAGHPQPNPENMAQRRADNWDKMLTLTPEQKKGVYAAELDFMNKMMKNRTPGTRPDPQEMNKAFAEKDEKFKAILTKDQWAKYDVARPKMPPAPPPPPAAPAVAPAPAGK